ncbi:MAG: twin-arginine translocase subunit TatC [Nitrospinota bacterium]
MNVLNATFFLLNLRRDFFEVAACIFILSILGYFISGPVEMLLSEPVKGSLAYFSLQEVFVTKIKLSVYIGFFLATPFVFFKIYKVCFPMTGAGQKIRGILVTGAAVFLFFSGAFLCHHFIVPFGMQVLLGFGGDVALPHISLSDYIDFCVKLILLFALCFELPLCMLALAKTGVVNAKKLSKMRRYAILGSAVLSAFITPPDVTSQVLVMLPLILLYEVSVGLVKMYEK